MVRAENREHFDLLFTARLRWRTGLTVEDVGGDTDDLWKLYQGGISCDEMIDDIVLDYGLEDNMNWLAQWMPKPDGDDIPC